MMVWNQFIETDETELVRLREYTAVELEVKLAILMDETATHETSLKIGALIDCYFNIYMFSNEELLSDEELLAFLKVQTTLLKNCENDMDLEQNLHCFREVLKTDENDTGLFEARNLKKIIDYMLLSFFQHYQLYRMMLTQNQEVKEITKEVLIDIVPTVQLFPPPLEESISKEWYDLYVNPVCEEVPGCNEEDHMNSDENVEQASNETEMESTANFVLSHLDKDEMKELITKVAQEKLTAAKLELEKKISEKETLLLKSLNKLQMK
ncbi:ciliary-associated calcium-binding coiled-coil protein 1-like isoform X2 [Hydractinia symbiolongicarpus]|uniref:ciliary-associated calcium-binding coiled-coil protein 1-like isoform X2 n=1 Tax=Hydractinia symbiolongicarpus TaxID=13093 RepID=UPI00254BA632|nr:ciliary-associated calcium-binding coiled-coil protein 1-like isoform X2 [Hydractinia symbiolongicarpus]